ncbi:MAG: FAD-binding oxidoreductase [Saprospiraceae bacterium]|nr:FAD-binding oxidoreductase [Saprospiraceae bacterium]
MKVDFIIVGQGLSGTLLAHQFESQGFSFFIIDEVQSNSSSRLAAGVMNPITGRRFVKSWMYDTLLPKALDTYRYIENKLDCSLVSERNILRIFPDQKQENDWLARSGFSEYGRYILDDPSLGYFQPFDKKWRFGEVCGSYQIDIPQLLNRSRERWSQSDRIYEEKLDHHSLSLSRAVTYKKITASHIVFCEGERLRFNPLFKSNILDVSRGDVLLLKIPNLPVNKMIKKKYFLIRLAGDRFWFGAKNSWDIDDTLPSAEFKIDLIRALEDLISVPYEIMDYKAAIRPTVQDRRPIIGKHPDHTGVWVFNGLGTKGASLGPYWAEALTSAITNQQSLPSEVDVSRFYS